MENLDMTLSIVGRDWIEKTKISNFVKIKEKCMMSIRKILKGSCDE